MNDSIPERANRRDAPPRSRRRHGELLRAQLLASRLPSLAPALKICVGFCDRLHVKRSTPPTRRVAAYRQVGVNPAERPRCFVPLERNTSRYATCPTAARVKLFCKLCAHAPDRNEPEEAAHSPHRWAIACLVPTQHAPHSRCVMSFVPESFVKFTLREKARFHPVTAIFRTVAPKSPAPPAPPAAFPDSPKPPRRTLTPTPL